MKRKALAFGGTRYMGKHLVKDLLTQKYEVTIATRGRGDFLYPEIKRQAERAIVQGYSELSSVRVRFPFVIGSDEAGKFLEFLGNSSFRGAVNGASEQTISIKEIADYVKQKTGKAPVFSESGEGAPYNGTEDYYVNTDKAKSLGFSFTPLSNWIYDLVDCYIAQAKRAALES